MHAPFAQPPVDAADERDHLGASVLRSLSRSYQNQFSTPAVRAGLFGFLTLGLLPLLRMRRQFRNYIVFERQQLWYLGEWLKARVGGEEASAFADSIKTLRYRYTMQWMQTWCLIAAAAVFVFYHAAGTHWVNYTLARTIKFEQSAAGARSGEAVIIPFVAWNICLMAAYLLHWVQVRRHRASVERVISRFNILARGEAITATMALPPVDPDFKWGAIGFILAALGAVWGWAMALAGAAQRRYINVTAAAWRADLLSKVREMRKRHRPAMNVSNYTIHARRCGNGLCRATLPLGARFCSRCGAPVSEVA